MKWSNLREKLLLEKAGQDPEEINDSVHTCPAARLERTIAQYRKTIHSTAIAQRIGISRLRRDCLHFRSWIEKLEGAA